MAIFTSDEIDSRAKKKKGSLYNDKSSIHCEDIAILNVYLKATELHNT